MAHSLFRLTQKVFNTPQLLTPSSMVMIAEHLNARNANLHIDIPESGLEPDDDDEPYDPFENLYSFSEDYKVGIIPICGVLTDMPFHGWCGVEGVSYTSIQANVKSLIEAGANKIVFDIDSGGGQAYGVWEAAYAVRRMADDAGVKIISYVDGCAASAAYIWAAISDEIVMNPMAEVGSIGVVVQLQNINRMKTGMGIDTTYIYAGANKIPFNAEGGFTEAFLTDIQEKVDSLYETFTEFVSEQRSISLEVVKGTEASTYTPDKAITLGLADSSMTRADFTDYIFKKKPTLVPLDSYTVGAG